VRGANARSRAAAAAASRPRPATAVPVLEHRGAAARVALLRRARAHGQHSRVHGGQPGEDLGTAARLRARRGVAASQRAPVGSIARQEMAADRSAVVARQTRLVVVFARQAGHAVGVNDTVADEACGCRHCGKVATKAMADALCVIVVRGCCCVTVLAATLSTSSCCSQVPVGTAVAGRLRCCRAIARVEPGKKMAARRQRVAGEIDHGRVARRQGCGVTEQASQVAAVSRLYGLILKTR